MKNSLTEVSLENATLGGVTTFEEGSSLNLAGKAGSGDSYLAGDMTWRRMPVVPSATPAAGANIYIVADPSREGSEITRGALGDGSPARPYNCVAEDSLRRILLSDTCVPPGSTVVLGGGVYRHSGIAGHGILLNKPMELLGPKVARVSLSDQRPVVPDGPTTYRVIGIGTGEGAPYSQGARVRVAGITIDANFGRRVRERDAGTNEDISQGAVSNWSSDCVLEDLDIVGCGELERPAESFFVYSDNQVEGSPPHRVRYSNLRFYDEAVIGGALPLSGGLGSTVFHIGGGVDGGQVDGLMENCTAERSSSGVCFGISSSNSVRVTGCENTIRDSRVRCTPVLHDTGIARDLAIRHCRFEAGNLDYAMVLTATSERVLVSENMIIRRGHAQAQSVILVSGNRAINLINSNIVSGTGKIDKGQGALVATLASPNAFTHIRDNIVQNPLTGITRVSGGDVLNGMLATTAEGNLYADGKPVRLY